MSIRRLELLQWLGFLFGGVVWFVIFVAGAGVAIATCNPAGSQWEIPFDSVQLAFLALGALSIAAAEAAAVLVFRATRGAEDEDPPPQGRMRLFAIGAMVGNVLFFVILVLSIVAAIVNRTCHQA